MSCAAGCIAVPRTQLILWLGNRWAIRTAGRRIRAAARASPRLRFLVLELRISRFAAAMQPGQPDVRGGVALNRCALLFGHLTPDLARHPRHQHPLRDLLPLGEPAAMIE